MYNVLLADDEPTILEGMRDLIDWDRLGFEITAVMDDGGPVIAYLQTRPVDVVITDVKMTYQSGIDIARYVHENGLHTKILLISGYKEVDLALEAIRYNAVCYILKPIDVADLEAQLIKLKIQLDAERQRRSNEYVLDYYKRNLEVLKDDFFIELATGSIISEKYLVTIFHLLYPHLDYRLCPCFLATIIFENYNEFLTGNWKHTSGELYAVLSNYISMFMGPVVYRMIYKAKGSIRVLGIATEPNDDLNKLAEQSTRFLCQGFYENFALRTKADQQETYSDIIALSRGRREFNGPGTDRGLRAEINEQEKMLNSALNEGDVRKLTNTLVKLGDYLEELDFKTAKTAAKEMFEAIRVQRDEMGGFFPSVEASLADTAEDMPSLRRIIENVFTEIMRRNAGGGVDSLIERAKRYIIDNITEDISLEDIAEKFYLSQHYFSRIFKLKTGGNLIDFIVDQKIEKAKALLRDPHYKVYEVSEKIGYRSNRYFTKVFKNYTGYTPSEYRSRFYSGKGGVNQ